MSDDNQNSQGGDDDQDAAGSDDAGTDVDDQDDQGGDDQDDQGDDEDKPLGPAGQKALEAEKAKRKKEATRRRAAEAELAALKGKGSDETEQARHEAEQAALAKANGKILKAEIRAAATGKLANPTLALRLLDLDNFEVDAEGEVDRDEIDSAIAELLKENPGLAAEKSTGKRFQGGGDGGVRGRTKGIDQQIADAEKKRDWNTARQLKLQKMTAGTKQ